MLHLLGQGRVGPLPFDLEALHPCLVLPELLTDGLEQLLDGLLPLGQLPVRGLAGLAELGIRQLEELLVVLLKGERREPGELPGQLLAGLGESCRPLLGRGALVPELRVEPGGVGPEGGQLLLASGRLVTQARPGRRPTSGSGPRHRPAGPRRSSPR